MAEIKKYLSYAGAEELVKKVKEADAAGLQAANDYADGLAKNYDAAGSAATAKAEAIADADAKFATVNANLAKKADQTALEAEATRATGKEGELQVAIYGVSEVAEQNKTYIAAIKDETTGIAAVAKKHTDDEVAKVQKEVDELEGYVGTFTSETAKSVVEYIDEKTSGIASDVALGALTDRVTQAEKDIDAIEADYLKAADKTELADAIALKATQADLEAEVQRATGEEGRIEGLVTAEVTRATGIEAGLRTDVDAIKADYLKAADKTELANAIAAEAERAAGIEESLQTQINTIMNNPDTEGVINSINEFTEYISEHGEIAEGFRTDIDANAKAIADLSTEVASTYETKEDATAKYNEVKAMVDEKAVQANWDQHDETSADYIKNRPFYVSDSYELIFEANQVETVANDYGHYSVEMTPFMTMPALGDVLRVELNGVAYEAEYAWTDRYCLGFGNYNICSSNVTDNGLPFFIGHFTTNGKPENSTTDALQLSTRESGVYDVKVYRITRDIKQLDEKFIPDTIARVTDVNAMGDTINAIGNAIGDRFVTVENRIGTAESNIQQLQAMLGEGGAGTVADMIATEAALREAGDAEVVAIAASDAQAKADKALADAKIDAATKDAVVLAEAQKATNAVQTAIDTHAGDTVAHVTADDKAKWNAAEQNAKDYADQLNATMTSKVDGIDGRVTTLEGDIVDKAEASDLEDLTLRVAKNETDIAANASAIAAFVAIGTDEIDAWFA